MLHVPEFAQLVDLPTVTPILKEIFGNEEYIVRGSRGDFNLPGAVWQALHADVWKEWLIDTAPTEYPDSGRLNYRDLPVFSVVINFNVIDIHALNAPIRQIPMTQHSQRPIPELDDEPLWMKRSTLCPAAAGSAIFRDPRAWHGGTPNLSNETRCMPNVEYYASWYRYRDHTQQMVTSMPREIYDQLSDFGQKLCREVVAAPGEVIDTGPRPNPYLLYKNHKECYKKMGLTDADLEEYREKGIYPKTIRTVRNVTFDQEASFYQRKKKPVKDEL
jgi:ectoine hydroxylase-related dioxygenase (phytanoyl-CoA dioxygenase family)